MAARANPAKLLNVQSFLVSLDGEGNYDQFLGLRFPRATVTDVGRGIAEVDITSAPLPSVPVYTNATRPDPAGYPAGSIIFNSDDQAINVADGLGNWRSVLGVVTATTGVASSSTIPTLPTYSNATRPDASAYAAGHMIFNTDDQTINVSNGSGGWLNPLGVLT